jgi:RNA polymerase sigma-70 factor, ECF subfamily
MNMASTQLAPRYEFDADYLHRLNARDPHTQDHFVTYFSNFVRMKLGRRSANPEQLNDLRQETFARVLTAIRTQGRIRQPECLGAYVSTICNNVWYESFRTDRNYQPIEGLPMEPQDHNPNPEAIVTGADAAQKLTVALGRLPERERTVLSALFLEHKEKDEVCRELGISRANLRLVVHRARTRLRRLCGKTRQGRCALRARV